MNDPEWDEYVEEWRQALIKLGVPGEYAERIALAADARIGVALDSQESS